jgi:hypothetical protein
VVEAIESIQESAIHNMYCDAAFQAVIRDPIFTSDPFQSCSVLLYATQQLTSYPCETDGDCSSGVCEENPFQSGYFDFAEHIPVSQKYCRMLIDPVPKAPSELVSP